MDEPQTLLSRLHDREDNGENIYPLWDGERVNLALTTAWTSPEIGAGVSVVPFGTGRGIYSLAAYVALGPWSLSLDVKVADLITDLRGRS